MVESVYKRQFTTMLEEGRAVELRMQAYFKQQGFTVVDRAEDVDYQKKGIDFDIYKDGKLRHVEVKTDNKVETTGNLFIEHMMRRCSGKAYKGWLHTCEADFICYHNSVTDKVYLIDWEKMQEEAKNFPTTQFKNAYDYGTVGEGHLVSVAEAKQRGLIVKVFDLVTV